MNLGVPSRFSVLKLEDDEPKQSKKKTNTNNAKKPTQKQNLKINSANKNVKNQPTKKKSKAKQVNDNDQWEQWKSIDKKKVSESYEDDLHEALIQSKMDFEKNKGQVNNGKTNKKKKKDPKPTVSLDQFNQMSSHQINHLSSEDNPSNTKETDSKFFGNIEKDAEEIVNREHKKDILKNREIFLADNVMSLQLQEVLSKKDAKIKELEDSEKQLTTKLKSVKERNRSLCKILAESEMKEKATILLQNQQLLQVKDELSAQVTELHIALEQEKSKTNKVR